MSDNQNTDAPDLENFNSDKATETTRQQDELILGKFKDYSELEKAYRESEKFISITRDELKTAQNQLEQLNATIPVGTSEYIQEMEQFMQENEVQDKTAEFISYFEKNPEILQLDNKTAFSFALKNLKQNPNLDVSDYINKLPPILMSGQGGEFITTPDKTPKTFEEAGDMFLSLLKK
jgi:Zn-dependent metalloprotease